LIKSILALVTACILVSYVSEGTANAQTVQQVCVSVKFSANEPYPLHGAAFLGCVDAARELIEKGADVNLKDKGGMTPVENAIVKGHVEMVQLLLSKGAKLTKDDGPIFYAVANDQTQMVKFLLDKDLGDLKQTNHSGLTPLELARKVSDTEMVTFLQSQGAIK
jgi:ankyrin repeat protein